MNKNQKDTIGHPLNEIIKPLTEYCICGHVRNDHQDQEGECLANDGDGLCGCTDFDEDTTVGKDY